MHPNEELITKFYTSFQNRDSPGMIDCYAAAVQFADPVFTDLKGDRAKAMWQMLCARGSDLKIVFSNVQANDDVGLAHWEATYTFSGRKVHNVIDAAFQFKNGQIVQHQDSFDLWKWAGMALGPIGVVLGWTPFIQKRIRQAANDRLDKFIQSKG
jgi:ketosteroid isomerase-like protein